jgi:hypothetical protein
MENEVKEEAEEREVREDESQNTPCVLEVVNVEELAVDGICGIY